MYLSTAIEKAVRDRDSTDEEYEILLVGHSLGALLLRKAYVFARGQHQDLPKGDRYESKSWPSLVKRIILLSSMNRGWRLTKCPDDMSPILYRVLRLLTPFARVFNSGRLIFATEVGAPFVTNLRLQWINLNLGEASAPIVVLLVGQVDDFVSKEDHGDLEMFPARLCVRYVGSETSPKDARTGHYRILRMLPDGKDEAVDRARTERREVFREALSGDEAKLLGTGAKEVLQEVDLEKTRLLFLVHGIRDYGDWLDKVKLKIGELASREDETFGKLKAVPYKYPYFSMMHFLFAFHRNRELRKFMDRYTEEILTNPNARDHAGYIGHSHGTHLLAEGLRNYQACAFERVALAGSVINRSFPWSQYRKSRQVEGVRNDKAVGDWIVGLFPGMFERLSDAFRREHPSRLGSGGLTGFLDVPAEQAFQQKLLRGGHGAALSSRNHESLLRYVVQGPDAGDRAFDRSLLHEEARGIIKLLRRLWPLTDARWTPSWSWLVWLILLTLVGSSAWFLCISFGWTIATLFLLFVFLVLFMV
jgi:hypothetical protein